MRIGATTNEEIRLGLELEVLAITNLDTVWDICKRCFSPQISFVETDLKLIQAVSQEAFECATKVRQVFSQHIAQFVQDERIDNDLEGVENAIQMRDRKALERHLRSLLQSAGAIDQKAKNLKWVVAAHTAWKEMLETNENRLLDQKLAFYQKFIHVANVNLTIKELQGRVNELEKQICEREKAFKTYNFVIRLVTRDLHFRMGDEFYRLNAKVTTLDESVLQVWGSLSGVSAIGLRIFASPQYLRPALLLQSGLMTALSDVPSLMKGARKVGLSEKRVIDSQEAIAFLAMIALSIPLYGSDDFFYLNFLFAASWLTTYATKKMNFPTPLAITTFITSIVGFYIGMYIWNKVSEFFLDESILFNEEQCREHWSTCVEFIYKQFGGEEPTKELYKELARITHPDKGGDAKSFELLESAWRLWK